MKKTALTMAIILGLGLAAFANPDGGGVFNRGDDSSKGYTGMIGYNRENTLPLLPNQHNMDGNQPASTPLGGGCVVFIGLGAAYVLAKKKENE